MQFTLASVRLLELCMCAGASMRPSVAQPRSRIARSGGRAPLSHYKVVRQTQTPYVRQHKFLACIKIALNKVKNLFVVRRLVPRLGAPSCAPPPCHRKCIHSSAGVNLARSLPSPFCVPLKLRRVRVVSLSSHRSSKFKSKFCAPLLPKLVERCPQF